MKYSTNTHLISNVNSLVSRICYIILHDWEWSEMHFSDVLNVYGETLNTLIRFLSPLYCIYLECFHLYVVDCNIGLVQLMGWDQLCNKPLTKAMGFVFELDLTGQGGRDKKYLSSCSIGTEASRWRHQMETISALLAICEWNPPVTSGFPSQRPVTRSFDVFFDPHMNKRLNKQSIRRWIGAPSRSLWRHCNDATFITQ